MSSILKSLTRSLRTGQVLLPVLVDRLQKDETMVAEGSLTRRALEYSRYKFYVRLMKRKLAEFNHDSLGEHRRHYVHPSSLGGCIRALWYRHMKYPGEGERNDRLMANYLTFNIGTAFHMEMQLLMYRAGVLVRPEALIIDDVEKVVGHCDAIVEIDGLRYLVELKSTNENNYAKVAQTPKHEHKVQSATYMLTLRVHRTLVIYWNKNSGAMREHLELHDSKFCKEQVTDRKARLFAAIRTKKPPEREGSTPNAPPCRYCPYVATCFTSKAHEA